VFEIAQAESTLAAAIHTRLCVSSWHQRNLGEVSLVFLFGNANFQKHAKPSPVTPEFHKLIDLFAIQTL